MSPEFRPSCGHRSRQRQRQQGLGLVSAIFVITIMALLAAGISSLVVTGQQSYGQDILSVRAFLAAQSGAQLAAHAVLPPTGSGRCATITPTLPAPGLAGCSVEASCASVAVASVTYYSIRSTGQCGAGADRALRQITLRLQDGSP